MDNAKWRARPFKVVLSVLGYAVWIVGLAGLPEDLAQWADWLPTGLLTNPAFYGPIGAISLFATYDLLFRDRLESRESSWWATVGAAHRDALSDVIGFVRDITRLKFLLGWMYISILVTSFLLLLRWLVLLLFGDQS